ncbi:MAG: polysaccharide deacetylase family protein, partial [Gammaproteobacteria bacterium]|nr:polysaccharide deacetylase family protein [Gammaproteobacteria bacterium]
MRKSDLVRFAGPLGLYRLAQFACRKHPRILMYHRFSHAVEPGAVSAATFEKQVRHVLARYNPVTMNDLARQLSGETPLRPNQVAITIDDGYLDFYEIAFPILRKLCVPSTLFVTSGFADGRLWLWPDKIAWLLSQTVQLPPGVHLNGQPLTLSALDEQSRARCWDRIVQFLLTLPDTQKHLWVDDFASQLDIILPASPPKAYAPATWDQLREMQSQGVEIGGHTVTHPSLGRVDSSVLREEVSTCLQEINKHLGVRPRPFCYPNGTVQDYSRDAMKAVEEAGYTCAVVAYADSASHEALFALRRHAGAEDMFQFMKATSGL